MDETENAASGTIAFLPWVTLPQSVTFGGFQFQPVNIEALADTLPSQIVDTVAAALRCYVGQDAKPIAQCTLVLRPRQTVSWNIPQQAWMALNKTAEILALACLSEQRFFEGHFSPHLNATMFRVVGQPVRQGSDQMALRYLRRDGDLLVGGRKFGSTTFQQPPQIEGTSCEIVNLRLARALQKIRRESTPLWIRLEPALRLFLLANSEETHVPWETCVMLSAMALERVLVPPQPNARVLAETFSALWAEFAGEKMAGAKCVKPDPNFARDQVDWPIHRKWAKELYEARSASAHRGKRHDLSVNWTEAQHMVIAAFVFPLIVKLLLRGEDLYMLTEKEIAACEALDALLDSRWRADDLGRPEWPVILSDWEGAKAFRSVFLSACREAGLEPD